MVYLVFKLQMENFNMLPLVDTFVNLPKGYRNYFSIMSKVRAAILKATDDEKLARAYVREAYPFAKDASSFKFMVISAKYVRINLISKELVGKL